MDTPPATQVFRWTLSEALQDVFRVEDDWLAGCEAKDTVFRFMLANAARIIDEEIQRHAAAFELGEAGCEANVWMVVRMDTEGNMSRGLMRIPAYSELHARYLLLLDCTQPGRDTHPESRAKDVGAQTTTPDDYYLPLKDVLAELCQDEETGKTDLLGIMDRFASIDLGRYALLPCDNIDLCALVQHSAVKRQVRFYA